MHKDPFPVKGILESLHDDVQSGTITLRQAAEELYKAGWSNFIDESKTRRLLNLQTTPHNKEDTSCTNN